MIIRESFDVVVAGGGSAGEVLAARLSTDPHRKVLLLEAGPNFEPDGYPKVLSDANVVLGSTSFDWGYHSDNEARLGHDIPLPRGRVVGGSSAVTTRWRSGRDQSTSSAGPSGISTVGPGMRP